MSPRSITETVTSIGEGGVTTRTITRQVVDIDSPWGAVAVDHTADFMKLFGKANKRGNKAAAQSIVVQAKKNASGRPGPRVITNRLRSSISSQQEGSGMDTIAIVGSDVDYAPPIELGTSRMKAYKFLEPAALEHLNEHAEVYAKVAKRVMEGR